MKRKRKEWTNWAETLLVRSYRKGGLQAAIAAFPGRTASSIRGKAYRMDLSGQTLEVGKHGGLIPVVGVADVRLATGFSSDMASRILRTFPTARKRGKFWIAYASDLEDYLEALPKYPDVPPHGYLPVAESLNVLGYTQNRRYLTVCYQKGLIRRVKYREPGKSVCSAYNAQDLYELREKRRAASNS